LLHLAPTLGALERNRLLIEQGTIQAAGLGAQWVISGELVVCGYGFEPVIGTEWILPQPDAWMSRLAELTARLGVVSFISHPERDRADGLVFNSLFVLGRDGQPLGRQRKLHPIPIAEGWSSPGDLAAPVTVDGVNVGLLICADFYRPEPAAELKRLGADLLISSAAWWPGEWGPHGEWEARSAETGLPVIVCNRTGVDGRRQLAGSESAVVDDGERILTMRAPDSTGFILDCRLRAGRMTGCTVVRTFLC
jgi:5-aminopentanamidase